MAKGRYPLGKRGKIIGVPYQGTHTMYGNWESDNAVDIAAPVGTPVYAVADGTIGSQIGALNSSDPHLLGLRVHLVTQGNEFYYAHLSRLVVKAGQHVKAGQLLGYSGEANGVAHLHFASENADPRSILGGKLQVAPERGQPPAPEPDTQAAPQQQQQPQAAQPPDVPTSLPAFTEPPGPPAPEDALPTIRTADTLHQIPGQYDFTRAWQQMAQLPLASDETRQVASWVLISQGIQQPLAGGSLAAQPGSSNPYATG